MTAPRPSSGGEKPDVLERLDALEADKRNMVMATGGQDLMIPASDVALLFMQDIELGTELRAEITRLREELAISEDGIRALKDRLRELHRVEKPPLGEIRKLHSSVDGFGCAYCGLPISLWGPMEDCSRELHRRANAK